MSVKINLALDIVLTAAFLVASNPPLTGQLVHEWFGLAFGAALVAHVVLHWEWMAAAATRLVRGRGRGVVLNSTVDAVLLIALTAAVLSGVMCSRHVLAFLGFSAAAPRGWREVHSFCANTSVAALGVHVGLHWNWIALNVPRAIGFKLRGQRARDGQPSAARA